MSDSRIDTVGIMLIVAGRDKKIVPKLTAALASISGYVDFIGIQLNAPKNKKINQEIRDVADRYADLVYDYVWTGNFVRARNDLLSKMPKTLTWVGFLDADDTWFNPELIQPIINKVSPNIDGILILYDYTHDEYDNVISQHWVRRLVRNNSSHVWKSSIDDEVTSVHETLVPVRNGEHYGEGAMKVIHHADRDHHEASLLRNIDLLKSMYRRQQKNGHVDPRILYYLGSHLYDAYDFQACLDLMIEYLKVSGWNEERSQAHIYIGKILRMRGDKMADMKARQAYLNAIGEDPKNENAYLELAQLEFEEKRYAEAVEFLKIGLGITREVTPLVKFNNQWQMQALMAECLVNLGGDKISDAMKYINKAIDKRPYDQILKGARDKIQFLIDERDDMRAANRLIRHLETDNREVLPFLQSLPRSLDDKPPVIAAFQRHSKPVKWPKKTMAIYVGDSSLGLWGPWSLNETGLGGSEEAVIRLSHELSKLGWGVSIYGTPGAKKGDYGDIAWRNYWELNPKDNFDVLVSWRQPQLFDYDIKARKKYLWLHDIMDKDDFTPTRLRSLDKVIFVSAYHADRPEFAAIRQRQKLVSSNGITAADFANRPRNIKRDPRRCIYTSANERGLRILYDIWPEIKKAVPKATLHSFYGWESFDAINRTNPERMMWKATMMKKAKDLEKLGVFTHGRISQKQMVVELFASGIWAYPSFFPEVSCISAMKAQAAGAIPVTSDFANLANVVVFGEKVNMSDFDSEDIERYKQTLIKWLLYPEKQEKIRTEMMGRTQTLYDWSIIAKNWDTEMHP